METLLWAICFSETEDQVRAGGGPSTDQRGAGVLREACLG